MNKFEVWPGPMEGVTLVHLVRAANELGLVDRWMTPFFRVCGAGHPSKRKLKEFISEFTAGGVPVFAQIMGINAAAMGQVAADFMELGAAGVNINFGCPSARVVSGGAGGGALRNPGLMAEIVSEVRRHIGNAGLSVKLRCGYSDFSETPDILSALAATGAVDQYFLHYRTVREQYRQADGRESRFRVAAAMLPADSLIVNGDVSTVAEGTRLVETVGAAGVMIARGWLSDPWLLKRFSDPAVPEADAGREIFFRKVLEYSPSNGQQVELARMLWGNDHPETIAARRRFRISCEK